MGKFEIGLATCWAESVTPRDSRRLAQHILSVPVYVAGSSPKKSVCLGACGPKLVDAYVRATTRTSAADPDSGLTSVSACAPLLFIQVPAWEKLFPDIEAHGPNLSRFRARIDQGSVGFDGRTVKTWILSLRPGADGSLARSLRLSLCRLHAEHEALKAVCRAVLTHQISIGPGSCGSDVTIVNAQQAWQHSSLDILSLLPELERLQSEMQHSAQSPEQFRALAEVADTSSAAQAKDGPKPSCTSRKLGRGRWKPPRRSA